MAGWLRLAWRVAIGVGLAGLASAQSGDLRVEIQQPRDGTLLPSLESRIEVEGGASIFGGVRHLDLFLVIDTSKSLERTDKSDYRVRGAVGLVKSLPAKSDIQLGVVAFDNDAELVEPLTSDRGAVVEALKDLDRFGSTDIAAGIDAALTGFAARARPGSSRVILLFTDGKSDEAEARDAARKAKKRGVALHTLMLGSDEDAARMLGQLARSTGGMFLRVRDPRKLPEAFMNLKTTGGRERDLERKRLGPAPGQADRGPLPRRAAPGARRESHRGHRGQPRGRATAGGEHRDGLRRGARANRHAVARDAVPGRRPAGPGGGARQPLRA